MTKKSSEPLDYVRLPTLQWWRIISIVFMLFCSSFNAFRRNTIHQNHFHCENLKFLRHPNRCSHVILRVRFCRFSATNWLGFFILLLALLQPQLTNGYKQFSPFSPLSSSQLQAFRTLETFHSAFAFQSILYPFYSLFLMVLLFPYQFTSFNM